LLPRLWLNRMKYGRALDILITHSPPRGIHDQPDLPHKGFEVFLPLLKFARPRYLLHGHIHLYRSAPQETQFESTKVINIYPLRVLEWA
jgi:Icc-related predicted phosphoesterase